LNPKVLVCIPTLNPGIFAKKMATALSAQSMQPDNFLIIDSESTDGSINVFNDISATIITINRVDFDHGRTRNIAFNFPADIYIFLTQDSIPEDSYAIERIVDSLRSNEQCGMAYGRQAPSKDATSFAKHARLFNYPEGDQVVIKSKNDISRIGIKTAFCSNSFSAYRYSAMKQINFFPQNTLFAEDSIAAATLLSKDWSIAYVPYAITVHSHNYTYIQEFSRYFDVGAFHGLNPWFISMLGNAGHEGKRFVKAEYLFLKSEGVIFPLIRVIIRNGIRWLGYKFGQKYKFFPKKILKYISMNKSFWDRID
jgi:rhamnosyltransferase